MLLLVRGLPRQFFHLQLLLTKLWWVHLQQHYLSALEKLEEKEIVLQKKISIEVERYKEFTKANNKQAAMQCLKRKKFYEVQIEHTGSFQLRIHDQEQKLLHKSPVSCREVQSMTSKNRSLKGNTA